MKRYIKEIIILLIQLFMFYIFPLFCGPTDVMGMVVLILISTIITGEIIGMISKEKIKYIYPIIIVVLFIPSVFIYYNKSAMIYPIWYLFSTYICLIIGVELNKLRK